MTNGKQTEGYVSWADINRKCNKLLEKYFHYGRRFILSKYNAVLQNENESYYYENAIRKK